MKTRSWHPTENRTVSLAIFLLRKRFTPKQSKGEDRESHLHRTAARSDSETLTGSSFHSCTSASWLSWFIQDQQGGKSTP